MALPSPSKRAKVDIVDQAVPEKAEFTSNTNESLFLRLVRDPGDLDSPETAFNPVYTHQLWGEPHTEKVFGYKNLRICIDYHAATLVPFIQVKYDDKVSPALFGVAPDDVMHTLLQFMPSEYCTSRADFLKVRTFAMPPPHQSLTEPFRPTGVKLRTFARDGVEYEVFKSSLTDPRVRRWHERIQIFVLFYIDGASYINANDKRWELITLWEKRTLADGSQQYGIMGYCTLYPFLAYPDNIRLRISQILIMPPYQKKGFGGELLQAIYDDAIARESLEVNVEDPSRDFTRLRDITDLRNIMKNGLLPMPAPDASTEAVPYVPWSPSLIGPIRRKLKLNGLQVRKCYEVAKLAAVTLSNEAQYRSYRLEVKRRLAKKHQEELSALEGQIDFKKKLQELYRDLEADYMSLWERAKV